MTDMEESCSVLVVGAGPTGLLAAILLARAGVSVRIVDARAAASDKSRALAIQARTLELLAGLGLEKPFLSEGIACTGIDFVVRGRRAGGFSYDRAASPDTPYPFVLLLPQSRTEAILIEELGRCGVAVERGVRVTGLKADANGVVAAVDRSGTAGAIAADYAIGADGAHSVVRKALGTAFEGIEHGTHFMLADCRVDGPAGASVAGDRMRVFMNGAAVAILLPFGRECSRVIIVDRDQRDGSGPAAAPDLPEVQAAFSRAAGQPVALSAPRWTTRYSVHSRLVPAYRTGRVLLAGDAAHIHSPAGGQGMNTGMQDVANLAWKLAAVIRTDAPDRLLNTYETERRPVACDVLETSDRMFNAIAGITGWRASLRDWVACAALAVVPRFTFAQRRSFRRLAQLEIAYSPSCCVMADHPGFGKRGPAPGKRAPDAAVNGCSGVFGLLNGLTVLALSRVVPAPAALCRLQALERAGVAVALVCPPSVGTEADGPAGAFCAYGLTGGVEQATYVVRPDGYVAWRSPGLDADTCERVLEGLLGPGPRACAEPPPTQPQAARPVLVAPDHTPRRARA